MVAPFVLDAPEALEVLAAPAAADTTDEAFELVGAAAALVAPAPAAGVEEAGAAVPPIGAVDWPSI